MSVYKVKARVRQSCLAEYLADVNPPENATPDEIKKLIGTCIAKGKAQQVEINNFAAPDAIDVETAELFDLKEFAKRARLIREFARAAKGDTVSVGKVDTKKKK